LQQQFKQVKMSKCRYFQSNLLARNNFKNMQKKPFLILIMLLAGAFITAFLNFPFAFIMSFCGLAYIGPILLASTAIWWILPQDKKDKFVNNKIKYYLFVIVTVLIMFLVLWPGRKVITGYYLANTTLTVRVFAKTILLMLILFVTGNLLKNKHIKTSMTCIVMYIVFVTIGFIGPAITNNSGTNDPLSNIKALTTLPYLNWASFNDDDKKSVTIYDPALSYKGINIYPSMIMPETFLFDMNGKILHKWVFDSDNTDTWHYSKLLENGDLIGSCVNKQILKKIDWNSKTIWELKVRCHHEITLKDNGNIYVLAHRDQIIFIKGFPVPIVNDYIAVVSPEGNLIKEIPILDAIHDLIRFEYAPKIYSKLVKPGRIIDFIKRKIENKNICKENSIFDIFHNNTITIADKNIEGVCEKSDILLSIRNFNLVAILDADTEKFIWTWGPGHLSKQHHPTFLENSNILIFDNGLSRGYSRIVELNPKTKQIEWDYIADPPETFFSNIKGSCQKLPNGNILITEATKGRIFEITTSGTIVWEYYNTNIDMKRKKRGAFYRTERIVNPDLDRNIKKLLSETNKK
jgi:Arylsulfotransferase (ASST)